MSLSDAAAPSSAPAVAQAPGTPPQQRQPQRQPSSLSSSPRGQQQSPATAGAATTTANASELSSSNGSLPPPRAAPRGFASFDSARRVGMSDDVGGSAEPAGANFTAAAAGAPPTEQQQQQQQRQQQHQHHLEDLSAAAASPVEGVIKFILLGCANVGKTSIMNRFCDGRFDATAPTIGVDFKSRNIDVDGRTYKLHTWDTAGQETMRVISRSYYRQADGVVFVYDVTDVSTLFDLDTFIQEAREQCPLGVPMVLLGNKADLTAPVPPSAHAPGFGGWASSGGGGGTTPPQAARRSGAVRSSASASWASPARANSTANLRRSGVVGGHQTSPPSSAARVYGSGRSSYNGAIVASHSPGNRVTLSSTAATAPGNSVSFEEGERFARKRGIQIFFETSAQSGSHIEEAFEVLCRHVVNNKKTNNELHVLTDDHRTRNSGAAPPPAGGRSGGGVGGAGGPTPVRLLSKAEASRLEERRRKQRKGEGKCPC